MGQARARGTFEERKAKAIAEGRTKTPAPIKTQAMTRGSWLMSMLNSFRPTPKVGYVDDRRKFKNKKKRDTV
jgi:hypothetical protein